MHPSPLPAEANPSPLTQPSQIHRNQFSFAEVEDQLQAETCSNITEGGERVEQEMWEQRAKLRLLAPCHLAMNLPKQSSSFLETLEGERGTPYPRGVLKQLFILFTLHTQGGFCCSKKEKPINDSCFQTALSLLRDGTLSKRSASLTLGINNNNNSHL